MSGRTTWFPRDAAWHRRELIVELAEEFGGEVFGVLDVLHAWAQEQNGGGAVKGGFRTLTRESFIRTCPVLSVLSRADEIGVLDDFEVLEDGRRFTCRISGWQADTARGRDTLNKRVKRATEPNTPAPERPDSPGQNGTGPDMSGSVRPVPLPHHTVKDPPNPPERDFEQAPEAKVLTFGRVRVSDETRVLAEAILDEFNRQAGTGYGAYRRDGGASEDLKRILGALREASPPLDLAEAGRMIGWRLARPFNGQVWDGKPNTGVVFGPKVFASNRESVRGGSVGRGSKTSLDMARELQQRRAAGVSSGGFDEQEQPSDG